MNIWDYLVFSGYLLGVLALGLVFRPARQSSREFFLARRSMGWFPIGLSVMVTVFSAVNFTAFPGEVLQHGLYVLASLPVFILVALPVTRVFIPFFHAMRLTSAYEFLEHRFDLRVRRLASVLFMLWRVLWMATILYATSKFLSGITGLRVGLLIVTAGVVATLYTTVGGMRAVIWTDVAQFFVFTLAMLVTLAVLVERGTEFPGGSLWSVAVSNGLFKPFHPFDRGFLSFDPWIRITLWSGMIGTFVAFLGRYGADQMVVQRYFTARSLRDAQRGFWLNILSALAALSLLVLLGIAAHLHAIRTGAWSASGVSPTMRLAALFVSLPAGLAGLLAAGLAAATMSSVDSGIHSCSTALTMDFLQAGKRGRQAGKRRIGPLLTLIFGALSIGLAFFVGRFGTLFDVANRIVNALGSPLLAVILLGMFSRRANSLGVLVGGVVGALWSALVSFRVDHLALHYYAVMNLAGTLVAGMVCSEIARLAGRDDPAACRLWTWRERAGLKEKAGE